jgi:hypothetical protein
VINTPSLRAVRIFGGVSGRPDQLRDRHVLCRARPGGQEVTVPLAVRCRGVVDRLGVLGVHDQQRAQAGDLGQHVRQVGRLEVAELVHAGVRQEALEAEHPGVVQPPQLVQVARHRAAPEPDVDARLVFGGLALDLQRGGVHRWWHAIQRHVQQGGDSAGSCRPGGGGEALPLGATGLVDVHVGIYQPGQQHLVVAQIDEVAAGELVVQRLDRHDPAVRHPDPSGHLPIGGDHPRRTQHQVQLGHARPFTPIRMPIRMPIWTPRAPRASRVWSPALSASVSHRRDKSWPLHRRSRD